MEHGGPATSALFAACGRLRSATVVTMRAPIKPRSRRHRRGTEDPNWPAGQGRIAVINGVAQSLRASPSANSVGRKRVDGKRRSPPQEGRRRLRAPRAGPAAPARRPAAPRAQRGCRRERDDAPSRDPARPRSADDPDLERSGAAQAAPGAGSEPGGRSARSTRAVGRRARPLPGVRGGRERARRRLGSLGSRPRGRRRRADRHAALAGASPRRRSSAQRSRGAERVPRWRSVAYRAFTAGWLNSPPHAVARTPGRPRARSGPYTYCP